VTSAVDAARLRALVVDDEPPARRRLTQLLEATGRVEVVALARSVEEALRLGRPADLDVAFLDVHMPGEDGFAYVARAPVDVPIVFVTADASFAVRAFDVAALDYLLKPVEAARLDAALDRVVREIGRRATARVQGHPGDRVGTTGPELLCLRVTGGARFVSASAIVCILARDDYTEVALDDGSAELVAVTMRAWEDQLPPDQFARLHRGAIAATARIERVERVGGRWLASVRGQREPIPISREVARDLAGRSRAP
jgi:two-component system LytT family response regulator